MRPILCSHGYGSTSALGTPFFKRWANQMSPRACKNGASRTPLTYIKVGGLASPRTCDLPRNHLIRDWPSFKSEKLRTFSRCSEESREFSHTVVGVSCVRTSEQTANGTVYCVSSRHCSPPGVHCACSHVVTTTAVYTNCRVGGW